MYSQQKDAILARVDVLCNFVQYEKKLIDRLQQDIELCGAQMSANTIKKRGERDITSDKPRDGENGVRTTRRKMNNTAFG